MVYNIESKHMINVVSNNDGNINDKIISNIYKYKNK